jgi:hypothetical protein
MAITNNKLLTCAPVDVPGWQVIVRSPSSTGDPLDQRYTIGVKRRTGLVDQFCEGAWTKIPIEFMKRTSSDSTVQRRELRDIADALVGFALPMTDGITPCETNWTDVMRRVVNAKMSKDAEGSVTWTDYDTTSTMNWDEWRGDWYRYQDPIKKTTEELGKAVVESFEKQILTNVTVHSTIGEEPMNKTREKQIYAIYRMTCVDNVDRVVVVEDFVTARSKESANIKFAKMIEDKIDLDQVGDRYDFYINQAFELFEPEANRGVQKVEIVNEE